MTEEINITVETILKGLAIITALGGATAVISRWFSPFKTLRQDVENKVDKDDFNALRREFDTVKGYQKVDHKELVKVELGNEKICKGILAIMDHELTGNSVDRLKKTKEELQDYLIEK